MNPVVEAQIFYLEVLRKHGLLNRAMENTLPEEIVRSARLITAARYKIPLDKQTYLFHVPAELKDECDAEIAEYLRHFKLDPNAPYKTLEQRSLVQVQDPIEKGTKRVVFRGSYLGHEALILGEDVGLWGITWMNNYKHPACEAYVFRMQRDKVPLDGRVFLAKLATGEEVLLHENEIGQKVR